MRSVFLAIGLAALVLSSPALPATTHKNKHPLEKHSPQKPLPIFSFQGSDTEGDQSVPETCKQIESEEMDCTEFNVTLAGSPVMFVTKFFYNHKLDRVYGSFGDFAYGGLLAAFSEKYGNPQGHETRKWESKGGAVFDNDVYIWRFIGGNLELRSMGLEVGKGEFDFDSALNSPPAQKPKVDF